MTFPIKRITWPLIVLAIVLCLLMITPVAAKSVTLTGTVTDSITGQPVSGATVTIHGTVVTANSASSGSDGHYTLNFATNGPLSYNTLYCEIHKDGYNGIAIIPIYTGSSVSSQITHDIQLTPILRTLTGTVTDSSDQPVEGATISIHGFETISNNTQSDSDGHYSLDFQTSGSLAVPLCDIHKDGYVENNNNVISLSGSVISKNFQLTLTQTLNGTVVDRFTGLPVSNAKILINGNQVISTADGSFTLSNVNPYTVGINGNALNVLASNTYWSHSSLFSYTSAELQRGSKDLGRIQITPYLAGYVTNSANQPVSGAQISLAVHSLIMIPGSATSDSNGYYLSRLEIPDGIVLTSIYSLDLTADKGGYMPYSTELGASDILNPALHNITFTPIAINNCTPDHAETNNTSVQFTLISSGIPSPQGVRLVKAGQTNITAGSVTMPDGNTITGTFNLTNAALGDWGIVVVNGDGAEVNWAGTFTVLQPLVANFTGTPTSGNGQVNVLFTDRSTGDGITSRTWIFGDGDTSTEQNPTHLYTTPGSYNVTLTVNNTYGSVSIRKPGYITVTAPVTPPSLTANFYAIGHVGQAPYSVRFMDQSAGSPTGWKWDFGDGNYSTEQNPTHIFTRTGAYNVALTASNDQMSDTAIQYRCIIVNTIPIAAFMANATSGQTPFSVQFTDQSKGASGFQWQFGDGATSTEQNPIHTYTIPGVYTVTQSVSEPDYGTVFTQKPGYIVVSAPSSIGFSANVTSGLSPLAVRFNESVTGSVQSQYWKFGDGGTSFEQNPVHIYDTAGRYTVSLMTIGSNGTETKTLEQYIDVTSLATPTVTPTATTMATVTPTLTAPPLPMANFTVTADSPGSFAIQVADTSVNATSVQYDLGDGTVTAIRNYQYIYSQAGTYFLTQTATNAAGSSNKTISVTVPAVPATTPTVSPTITSSAFNGPHNLPGILQAEDYDLGGEGVAYHDTTPGNMGGAYRQDDVDIEVLDTDQSPNVGWIRAGEWLTYTVNVGTAGTYDAGFRVASSHSGSYFQVYLDDGTMPVATVTVPNTGDWPVFQTVSAPMTLPAGQHRLKLTFPTDYANINWITFALSGE